MFGGWQFSGIATLQDGTPFMITSGRDNSLQGVNIPYGADRPDVLGDPKLPADRPIDERLARYFDTSKFVMNGQGQFGNVGRNTFAAARILGLPVATSAAVLVEPKAER